MENLRKLIEELKTRPLKITVDKNGKTKIHQTQRNELKKELQNAIMLDLRETLDIVAIVRNGTKNLIGLEIPNDSIADNLPDNCEGSGAITATIDCTITDLDNSFDELLDEYAQKQAENEEKAKAKAESKAKKIARDTASREKKGE